VVERDCMRQTRAPKGHFKKILQATYRHHPYPIKHKLRECTMIKRFMSSADALPSGDELTRNPRNGGMVLGQLEVATITQHRERYMASWGSGPYSLR
jgi:hypothetical protein